LPGERPDEPDAAAAPGITAPAFDVVVIGASAGGLSALATLFSDLPAAFPVAVALVLHLSPGRPSALIEVLARQTQLRVRWAADGSRLEPGVVFVAPPDQHLVFQADGRMSLAQTPPVHFSRPSVDLLFASAARAFGQRTLAVILTGNGYDGSNGVPVVHDCGGVVIAQDEASSQYFGMPQQAIASGGVSFVLPLAAIGPAVRRLVALGSGAGAVEAAVRPPAS
jgi:two-component system chemotaxis response regulator CheB